MKMKRCAPDDVVRASFRWAKSRSGARPSKSTSGAAAGGAGSHSQSSDGRPDRQTDATANGEQHNNNVNEQRDNHQPIRTAIRPAPRPRRRRMAQQPVRSRADDITDILNMPGAAEADRANLPPPFSGATINAGAVSPPIGRSPASAIWPISWGSIRWCWSIS